MKQPKAQDHIRHTELLKVFAGVQELENALIPNFKTEGKGLFLQTTICKPEACIQMMRRAARSLQGLLTKKQPVSNQAKAKSQKDWGEKKNELKQIKSPTKKEGDLLICFVYEHRLGEIEEHTTPA